MGLAVAAQAELVVLAACHSGSAVAGRGLDRCRGRHLGLQAVLFDAGAGSVLDAVAGEMRRRMRSWSTSTARTPAARRPRRRCRRPWSRTSPIRGAGSVFYWAPFFVTSLGGAPRRSWGFAAVPAALS
jgi:hypothetical protein